MEGVRRLRIFLDGQQILKTRTPTSFQDLLKTIKKLNRLVSGSIALGDQTNRFEISNESTYQEALQKTKSNEIFLHLLGADPSSINTFENLIENKLKTLPIKRKPRKVSSNLESNKKFNPKSFKTSEDCIDIQAKIEIESNNLNNLLDKVDQDLKLGSEIIDSKVYTGKKFINHQVKHKNLGRVARKQKIFNPEIMKKSDNSNVDVFNSFSCIQDEGELKLIDSDSSDYLIISDQSINKSSRLLLTTDGLLITGGSSAPSQAMMVKSDYTISTLKPMNHQRYWHCMGYLDGHPAVVGGAENSPNSPVFTNTVEIYKEGAWQSYPPTNFSRASASMSWDSKSAYIIGGATTDGVSTTVVNLIEKWDSTRWIVLNVVIPTSLLSCGSFPKGKSEVFIFGGQQAGGVASNKKFILNLDSGSIQSEDDLESESKFTYGQEARKIGSILKVCNSQGKVLELEYEKPGED